MKVSEAMTREVRIASPDESICEAARAMAALDAGVLPVADEDRAMPLPAVDPRPAVPGVGRQQLLQQTSAELGHRGAHGQFHRGQARARAQRVGHDCGQPVYLGGDLRRDLLGEPLMRVSGSVVRQTRFW